MNGEDTMGMTASRYFRRKRGACLPSERACQMQTRRSATLRGGSAQQLGRPPCSRQRIVSLEAQRTLDFELDLLKFIDDPVHSRHVFLRLGQEKLQARPQMFVFDLQGGRHL